MGIDAVKRRAVFLDRDGVLNEAIVRAGKPFPPATLGEFRLLPGVEEACARLHAADFLLVVVTNQPDVGRGTQTQEVVEAMHQRLRAELPLAGIEVCYHPGGAVKCSCRKPAPGMIFRAVEALEIDVAQSFMVGDRWRDVACGKAAGCRTIFVNRGYAERLDEVPDFTTTDLPAAAEWILAVR